MFARGWDGGLTRDLSSPSIGPEGVVPFGHLGTETVNARHTGTAGDPRTRGDRRVSPRDTALLVCGSSTPRPVSPNLNPSGSKYGVEAVSVRRVRPVRRRDLESETQTLYPTTDTNGSGGSGPRYFSLTRLPVRLEAHHGVYPSRGTDRRERKSQYGH